MECFLLQTRYALTSDHAVAVFVRAVGGRSGTGLWENKKQEQSRDQYRIMSRPTPHLSKLLWSSLVPYRHTAVVWKYLSKKYLEKVSLCYCT